MNEKLTHDVILAGAFVEDPQAGDCIRFFDKSRLKDKGEFLGPLVFHPTSVDSRFLNLLLAAPTLYQAAQRAKLDAMDLQQKLTGYVTDEGMTLEESRELITDMLSQLIALQHVMDIVQKTALEGIESETLKDITKL